MEYGKKSFSDGHSKLAALHDFIIFYLGAYCHATDSLKTILNNLPDGRQFGFTSLRDKLNSYGCKFKCTSNNYQAV
jgi:hypothetical protein